MQSRWLLNLVLLLAVAGLAALVFVSQSGQSQQATLTTLDKSTVSTITIPRADKNIVLQKSANGWRMQSPYAMNAHAFRVNRLLDLLAQKIEKCYDINGQNLKQYDLDPPRAEIRFDSTSIQYGNTNTVNQKRYVRAGNRLCLISDDLYPLISAEPSSFVDVDILPASGDIIALQLPGMNLGRQADKSWKNEKGEIIAADRMQQLLDAWLNAQAFGVHAYLKRDNAGKIVLRYADNSRLEFDVIQTRDWLILGRADLGVEYHLALDQAQELLQLKPVKPENG
jgi:hypothetical protein